MKTSFNKTNGAGLMFHHFHKNGGTHDYQGSISESQFREILFSINQKNLLSAEEWLRKAKENKLKSSDLCITLDDGLLSQYDICLPILAEFGISAFWFIYSAPLQGEFPRLDIYRRFRTKYFSCLDEYLNAFLNNTKLKKEEITVSDDFRKYKLDYQNKFPFYTRDDIILRYVRDKVLLEEEYIKANDKLISDYSLTIQELAADLWITNGHLEQLIRAGQQVGLHSYSHPIPLANLSISEQAKEYDKNMKHLKQFVKAPITSMSHPADSYSKEGLELLEDMGIICGFRSNLSNPRFKSKLSYMQIPRYDSINLVDNQ